MEGRRLIHSLRLRSFLSYGPAGEEIELGPLNVLIGPNASGKSNLIAALAVLRAAPSDVTVPFRESGSIEWLWKGGVAESLSISATVASARRGPPIVHTLEFGLGGPRLELQGERIDPGDKAQSSAVGFFLRFLDDAKTREVTTRRARFGSVEKRQETDLDWSKFASSQSVLSQLREPTRYPEITYLARQLPEIRIYRNWSVSRSSPLRTPQKTDLPEDFLLEDASNLALVLNDLEHRHSGLGPVVDRLRAFYAPVERITTKVLGGTIQVYVHERGLSQPIPASRMSDGMLRYLCLLTILCHPSPPPLICIEEPELGLHPDALGTVAELLVEASKRTQLIVTTHSDILVSALGDVPEAVLVCERDGQGTVLRRLEEDKLKEWLEDYTLGDLWLRGKIGGTTT